MRPSSRRHPRVRLLVAVLLSTSLVAEAQQPPPDYPPPPTYAPPPPPPGQPPPQPYYPPPGQPVYPQGQPVYPQGQPAYPQGQPAYPQGQPVYPAQPYMPPPPQPPRRVRYEVRRPNTGLLVAGLATLGGGYLLTALPSAFANFIDEGSSRSGVAKGTYWPMYIPVVGPFIQIAAMSGSSYYGETGTRLLAIPCVFAGLIQTTGLALTIAGAVTGRRVAIEEVARLPFDLSPVALPGGGGLAASGRF